MTPYMNISTENLDKTVGVFKTKRKKVSDTIYTFDIETTSLFDFDYKWDIFDYSKDNEYYSNRNKIAIPYIWQFGIEEQVFYGRDFFDFEKVLNFISDKNITKIIWVHNLSYEFGFLPNILSTYNITNMCARDIRKPISFHIEELNIDFRCSYMLTNLSLKKASEEYTDVKKLDTLEYDSKIRTPLTTLTDDEMRYCEYDIICLYNIIKYYRNKYEHISKIPLTSTGEVRKELLKHVGYYYLKKQWELVPTSHIYLKLMSCFQGGYTHANILNVNKIINNVKSYDISSSYPTVMCLEKFPATPFIYCDLKHYEYLDKTKYCFMFRVKINNVNSKYYNNYIAYSKCLDLDENSLIYDNGRIRKCDYVEMYLTDVDLEIIKKNYNYDNIEYIEIYYSEKRYLDINVIKFILELYGNKTTLKGVDDKIDIYKKSKSYINSLYGMSVTNPLKNSAEFQNNEWYRKELNDDFVNEVLQDAKKSYSTLFYYAVGVWVTAYARRNLYMTILTSHDFDRHVIYCDTDSIKYYGDYDYIFEEYNNNIFKKYDVVCKNFSQLKKSMFTPKDQKGKIHPIGIFDYEGEYEEFKTLGAKKYVYIQDGIINITVAGVPKTGSVCLNNLDEFKKGYIWDYRWKDKQGNEYKGKLQHYYNEEQPQIDIIDDEGNLYHNNIKYGVILQPTTYKLGMTDIYESLIEYIQEGDNRKHE